ncbi:meiosis 1 arrest protein [Discoglossus pictus]
MSCSKRGSVARVASRPRVPPQVLILDVAPPGWDSIGGALCEALSNALYLNAAAAQPARLLSIYTVRERHQCVLPLLHIGGSLSRLQSCLSELRSLPRSGLFCAPCSGSFALAVLDALQQNKQLSQHSSGSLHPCYVEVTAVSPRSGHEIVSELDSGLKNADLGTLRRLLVVYISERNRQTQESSDPSPEAAQGPSFCDIELRVTSGDILSLESFFKSWLFETGPEREQINLTLPQRDSPLCVMCDVQQCLVNPDLLLGTRNQNPEPSKSNNGNVTQTLKILRAVSSQGVCGSILYGVSSILSPTACWELDWEELETNQEIFVALCHSMQSQNLCLLACSSQGSNAPSCVSPVLSHYILSASDSAALLLRPVAVRELVLPIDPVPLNLPVRDSALHKAQEALRSLEVDSVFNPLLVTCNLYRQLQNTMVRAPPARSLVSHVSAKREGPGVGHRQASLRYGKARATVAPLPLVAQAPVNHSRPYSANKSDLKCQASFLLVKLFLLGAPSRYNCLDEYNRHIDLVTKDGPIDKSGW